MWRDLERICAEQKIPMQRPSVFPRNGLLAARVACWFQDEPWLPEFVRGVYLANFARDRDISAADEIAAILDGIGQPRDRLSVAEKPEAKAKLRDQTAQRAQPRHLRRAELRGR